MFIGDSFGAHLGLPMNFWFCVRMLLASFCGAAIGFERSKRFKEAGIRTHIIVCCAAALFMIVSKYGFADMVGPDGAPLFGTKEADPARIAAQVVTGISFLGAGVIFKHDGIVRGLTTAAGIWLTAAVGLAIGAGMYAVGFFGTLVIALLQIAMHRFTIGADSYATNRLCFHVQNGHHFNHSLTLQLEAWKATVSESRITRHQDGTTDYDFTVRRLHSISYDEFKAFMDLHPEILSGSNNPIR